MSKYPFVQQYILGRADMKKIVAIVMSIVCVLSFASCGKKEGMQQAEDRTDVTFEGKNIEIEGIEGRIVSYTVKNRKLYVLTDCEGSGDETTSSYHFYSVNPDGNHAQLISSQSSTEENIVSFCVDAAENMIYLFAGADNEEYEVGLVKIDKKGNELSRQNITEMIKDDTILISGIVSDNHGQVALACGKKVYFFDEQLKGTGEVQTQEGYVVDIALTKNGELVCVTDQLDSDEVALKVYLLDAQTRKWGDWINIQIGGNGESDYVIDGLEYDFYYKGRNGIYGYNIGSSTQKELINYDASYMTSADTEGMMCIDKDIFMGKSEEFTDGKMQITLVTYTKKDMTTANEKKEITFGTFRASGDVKSAVAKYNRSNPEYQIVIQEYLDMDEERLLADIATGNGQDIMDLSMFPLSVEQCVSKGLVEDLTPYYEKDTTFHTDNMIDSVKEAMEYDGKLYYVTPSFSLTTIAAKTEDVGNGTGWTVSEFKDFIEKKGKDVDLFDSVDIKGEYLWYFLNNNISDYIDWKNGTCSFDSEDFKYILELCNEKGTKDEENVSDAEIMEGINSMYSRFQDGEYILLQEDSINLDTIQFERKVIDADITYIGFPNKEKQGSYFQFNNKFAISSQSKVKEQAWEFIRTFMSKEYQKSITCDCCMPVFQDMFDSKIKALTATEAYVNEFGETVEPVEEYKREWGDIEVVVGVPTKEDVDVYLDLIHQTKRAGDSDSVVFDIIYEEAESYFKGRKKLDKTIDIIQNRVTTYVNEQKK